MDHTSHHEWVFETAFSSPNDEVIADAVTTWITDHGCAPPGSCTHYLTGRVESDTPFSPRLRRVAIRAMELIGHSEFKVSGLETVCLLNRLNIDVGEVEQGYRLVGLLAEVIRSPMGFESLSSHCWHLLDKLAVGETLHGDFVSQDTEVMRLLEKAEDWEKLEVWMAIIWRSPPLYDWPTSESKDIERATLKLLLRRPSAFPKFKNLYEWGGLWPVVHRAFRQIYEQALTEQLPTESLPPP